MATISKDHKRAALENLPDARANLAAARARAEAKAKPSRRASSQTRVPLQTSQGDIVSVPAEALEAHRHGLRLLMTGTDAPSSRLPYRDAD